MQVQHAPNILTNIVNKLTEIESELEILSNNPVYSSENKILNKSKMLLDIVVNFIKDISDNNDDINCNKNFINYNSNQPFSFWSSPFQIINDNNSLSSIDNNSLLSIDNNSFSDIENKNVELPVFKKSFASVLLSTNQESSEISTIPDYISQSFDDLEYSENSEDSENNYYSNYDNKFNNESIEMQEIYKKYYNTSEFKTKLIGLAEKRSKLQWHCWYNLTEQKCEKGEDCLAVYHYNNLSKDELVKIRSSVCCPLYIFGMCKKGCPDYKLLHVPSDLKIIGRKKCTYNEKHICTKGKYCYNYHC